MLGGQILRHHEPSIKYVGKKGVEGLGLGLAGYGITRGASSGWGHGKLAAEKSRKKAEKKGKV